MNNFEKIKQMTVDEMAEWLKAKPSPFKCEFCNTEKVKTEDYMYCYGSDCQDGIKQYLLQEVEE